MHGVDMCFFFFFSSRRRHTRLTCDWSSDVCSSDLLVVRFVPRNWLVLERPVFWPVIVSGQQSLEVFCVGIFLSSLAHFILVEVSNEIWMQVLVSLIGVAVMTGVAAYRSWSKKIEKTKGPSPAPVSA